MSSDSEDDFSYTNSVSLLKTLKQNQCKKNEEKCGNISIEDASISIDCDSPANEIRKIIVPEVTDIPNRRSARIKKETVTNKIKNSSKKVECIEILDNSDVCVTVSDDEPTNGDILSTIDKYLTKQGRRRARKSPKTRRVTRQSLKAQNKIIPIPDVQLIEDFSKDTFEDLNYEVSLKVYWKSQHYQKFTLRRFEKISGIFEYFAAKEKVPEDRLLFTIKNRIISKNDTPDSLDIDAATIIEGGILSETSKATTSNVQVTNQIQLKVLLKDRKQPLVLSMKITDEMKVLMCKCYAELGVANGKLKFYFDGDLIKPNETPTDLQLEGGECIDCVRL